MSIFEINLFNASPKADERFVVRGDNYRITLLTERLLRLEYSKNGIFENRATRIAFNRAFDTPSYECYREDGYLHIITKYLHLTYDENEFSPAGLQIELSSTKQYQTKYWYYGMTMPHNLGGTLRTLDGVNGAKELPDGLLTQRSGYSVVDDSQTIAIGEDGWPVPVMGDRIDLYFFGYFQAPEECIRDFYKLASPPPLLPRFALGNWWSRYYKYSGEQYLKLMDKFAEKNIPLAVGVVDMDWHVTRSEDQRVKWTGFTWNEDLFPDYKVFLAELHKRGIKTALNLHPREGILSDEIQYEDMCEAMGRKSDGHPVCFDASDRRFLESYFEKVLHPYEKDGVDFWWLDWQQPGGAKKQGYDVLWMLNHTHYLSGASEGKRPLNFSRYAEIGSHRYPVGFSGDTVISWESLDFQPYFTATASNVGFSWWSHDIGGFASGIRCPELYTRWVQLGVFSPIFRLHSAPNEYISKEPWKWGEAAERIVGDFMRLRHRLIPYIYTMMVRNHEDCIPFIRPMYHVSPTIAESYSVKNVFWYGSSLVCAPITKKCDGNTGLARSKVWLPEGKYIDFFNGRIYRGGRTFNVYRTLDETPVFAKAGSIIPLADEENVNSTDNPASLELRVFGGADGSFTMTEDNGAIGEALITTRTEFSLSMGEQPTLTINSPKAGHGVPANRRYCISFVAFKCPQKVTIDGKEVGFTYDSDRRTVMTDKFDVAEDSKVSITLATDSTFPENETANAAEKLLLSLKEASAVTLAKIHRIIGANSPVSTKIAEIFSLDIGDYLKNALLEILTEY